MYQAIVFLPLLGAIIAGLIALAGAHARHLAGSPPAARIMRMVRSMKATRAQHLRLTCRMQPSHPPQASRRRISRPQADRALPRP
jgi:hypothetical protein